MKADEAYPPESRDAMEKLYLAALDSRVTELGADFLFRARLLLRIADHDVKTAGEAIHTAGRPRTGNTRR